MKIDLNIMVGGEAGQGVQSVGTILTKTLAHGGLHIFADQDYESRVRGGHNFFRIRVSNAKVQALSEKLDMAGMPGLVHRHIPTAIHFISKGIIRELG